MVTLTSAQAAMTTSSDMPDVPSDSSLPREEAQRRRNNQKGSKRKRAWYKVLRQRMRDGLEQCRKCGSTDALTFAHLVAARYCGKFARSNLTILCAVCQRDQGSNTWTLPSLEDEGGAPPCS